MMTTNIYPTIFQIFLGEKAKGDKEDCKALIIF